MASITDTVVSGVNNILNVFSPQTVDANKDLSSGDSKESEEMDVDDESGTYKIIFLGKDGEPVETIDISQGNINLHLDDSIRVVKNKLLKLLEKQRVSYKEIYLFSKNKIQLDLNDIYKKITKNGEQSMDDSKIKQICSSLGLENVVLDESKKTYSLEEFLTVIDDKEYTAEVPIGQRFETSYQWLFSANPYHISMVLPDVKKNPLFSFENSLLMNYGNPTTIFVCGVENVLEFTQKLDISDEYVLQMYFPFLFKDGIRTLDDLLEKKQSLLDAYTNSMDENTWKLYETVDLFHEIYDQSVSPLPYSSSGITAFRAILHADFANILPLDTIFKRIHAIPNIPFIKYNPGFKRENIYRLYSDKIATNGKKIPVYRNYRKKRGEPDKLHCLFKKRIKNNHYRYI